VADKNAAENTVQNVPSGAMANRQSGVATTPYRLLEWAAKPESHQAVGTAATASLVVPVSLGVAAVVLMATATVPATNSLRSPKQRVLRY
jgi:hypothetical protein